MQKLAMSNVFREENGQTPLEDADAADIEEIIIEEYDSDVHERILEREAAHPENFIWHPGRKF